MSAVAGERARFAGQGPRLVSPQGDWPLSEGANLVGRDPDCAVCIESPTVSRHHARVVVSGGDARVEDLTSKNGTYVDGHAVTEQPVPVVDGSEIRFGSLTMTYRNPVGLDSTLTQLRV